MRQPTFQPDKGARASLTWPNINGDECGREVLGISCHEVGKEERMMTHTDRGGGSKATVIAPNLGREEDGKSCSASQGLCRQLINPKDDREYQQMFSTSISSDEFSLETYLAIEQSAFADYKYFPSTGAAMRVAKHIVSHDPYWVLHDEGVDVLASEKQTTDLARAHGQRMTDMTRQIERYTRKLDANAFPMTSNSHANAVPIRATSGIGEIAKIMQKHIGGQLSWTIWCHQ